MSGHPRHIGRRHLRQQIAVEEHQPPIAAHRPLAQFQADLVRVLHEKLLLLEQSNPGPLHFLGGQLLGAQLLHDPGQDVGDGRQIFRIGYLGQDHQHARVTTGLGSDRDAAGLPGVHQGLIQPPGGRQGQDVGQDLEGREIAVAGRGNMVNGAHQADLADAAQHHGALAVLGRFLGVGFLQASCRPGQHAEVPGDQRQGPGLVEMPGDDEESVVGLIILAIKGLQTLDGHPFDIAAVADGRFAVVVPLISDGQHPLHQNGPRVVLAHFKFVADHGHFRIQVGLPDETVDQAVRFQMEGELQVLVRGGHGLEVTGAVQPGGAVETGAVVAQHLGDLREGGRALEEHVFQQVGHARLPVTFLARSDQDGQVDRKAGRRGIRIEKDAQAIGKAVFCDTLKKKDLLRRWGIGGEESHRGDQESEQDHNRNQSERASKTIHEDYS